LARKLKNFFVEATFENPNKSEGLLVVTKNVDHYDFEINSPKFTSPAEAFHWYSCKVILYADDTKKEIIGRHYQLIYQESAAQQRMKHI